MLLLHNVFTSHKSKSPLKEIYIKEGHLLKVFPSKKSNPPHENHTHIFKKMVQSDRISIVAETPPLIFPEKRPSKTRKKHVQLQNTWRTLGD